MFHITIRAPPSEMTMDGDLPCEKRLYHRIHLIVNIYQWSLSRTIRPPPSRSWYTGRVDSCRVMPSTVTPCRDSTGWWPFRRYRRGGAAAGHWKMGCNGHLFWNPSQYLYGLPYSGRVSDRRRAEAAHHRAPPTIVSENRLPQRMN